MALGKQAKVLSPEEEEIARVTLASAERNRVRNQTIFLLSIKAGLRAKEIAMLRWRMVLNPLGGVGNQILLENVAAKGKAGGRAIPMNKALQDSLRALLAELGHAPLPNAPVIRSARSPTAAGGGAMTPQAVSEWFSDFYAGLGFEGCTSHSGRRTFITRAARRITEARGSLRDVQLLAGHSNLTTTQIYIDGDSEAQRKVVDLI